MRQMSLRMSDEKSLILEGLQVGPKIDLLVLYAKFASDVESVGADGVLRCVYQRSDFFRSFAILDQTCNQGHLIGM